MTQVTYDSTKVILVVDGIPCLDPAKVDGAIMAEYADDRVAVVLGLYGQGSFEVNVNTNGTFTYIAKARSSDNARFSAIQQARRQVKVALKNANTNNEIAFTRAAMIQTVPAVGGGASQGDRAWVFAAAEMVMIHDGHREAVLV